RGWGGAIGLGRRRAGRWVRVGAGESRDARIGRRAAAGRAAAGDGGRRRRGEARPLMAVAIVTGASGLVGSEAVAFFAGQGFDVVGVDDLRGYFFGPSSSTRWNRQRLESTVRGYPHVDLDIPDPAGVMRRFADYGRDMAVTVPAAAQPSHDWAAREPLTDFSVNATGTIILLEATRRHGPDAVFIFTSTNKVYGDTPNRLPLVERDT